MPHDERLPSHGSQAITLAEGTTPRTRSPGQPLAVPGYRAGPEIARGGMGTVHDAERIADGAPCVLKVLLPKLARWPSVHAQVRREANLLRKLQHPNVVLSVGDGTTSDGRPFVALERLVGSTLRHAVTVGAPAAGDCVGWTRAVLEALEAVHALGFVHGDVKLDNVFVTDAGDVRLIDFGAARPIGHEPARVRVGTPRYMAPEQAAGGAVDPRTDVYAVGLLLEELLECAPGASKALVSVARRASARQPEGRYASARAMEWALSRVGTT